MVKIHSTRWFGRASLGGGLRTDYCICLWNYRISPKSAAIIRKFLVYASSGEVTSAISILVEHLQSKEGFNMVIYQQRFNSPQLDWFQLTWKMGYHHFLSRKNDYGRTTHRICRFLSLKGDQRLVPFSCLQDVNGPPNAKSRRFGNSASSAAPMGFVSVWVFPTSLGFMFHWAIMNTPPKKWNQQEIVQNPSLFHPFFSNRKYTFLEVVYSPLHELYWQRYRHDIHVSKLGTLKFGSFRFLGGS